MDQVQREEPARTRPREGPLGLDAGDLAALWHNRASQNVMLHMMWTERSSGDSGGVSVALGVWVRGGG